MCVQRLLNRPLSFFRRVTGRDLFIIGDVEAEFMPAVLRFALDRYFGFGFPGKFWAVNVKTLMMYFGPKSVEEVVHILNLTVLEEVCHYLGWLHLKNNEFVERDFLDKIVSEHG
ncbi:MAG: hypothetical protein QXV01_09255 [Candidatus Bathyarchaeia archaeon]